MEKINFEDGQLVKKGYVEIDGTQYPTEEAQYDGSTPLSAFVLNKMQDNIEEAINNIDLSNYYNKEEVDNKVANIQALPVGGTTGQVLTKQSDTDGDASWQDSGDTLPIGSIVDYEGDTVPEGYVEVDDENNYSTEETVIGKWLGKPLYRKVIDYGYCPNNTYRYVDTGIENLDKVIRLYGNANASTYSVPLPNTHFNLNSVIPIGYYRPNNSVFLNVNSQDNTEYYCYVIIEYTKTTD